MIWQRIARRDDRAYRPCTRHDAAEHRAACIYCAGVAPLHACSPGAALVARILRAPFDRSLFHPEERCSWCLQPLLVRPEVHGLACLDCDLLWSATFPPSSLR